MLRLGHGAFPSGLIGDVEHHQSAMAALFKKFTEPSALYPRQLVEHPIPF
jgi:hypothetical protein